MRRMCRNLIKTRMYTYINPKYLLLEHLPWAVPYVILNAPVTPEMAQDAIRLKWGKTTPPLFFVPATAPGTISWAAYTRALIRSGQTKSTVEEYQRRSLRMVLLTNTPEAPEAIALGERHFAAGKKADPTWLPEPDPIWLDLPLHGGKPPWDGWEKWAARHRLPSVPEEQPTLTKSAAPAKQPRKTREEPSTPNLFS